MTREFRIELCGIQHKYRNVLKRILAITEERACIYSLFGPEVDKQSDILIVDGDDPVAVDEWTTNMKVVTV